MFNMFISFAKQIWVQQRWGHLVNSALRLLDISGSKCTCNFNEANSLYILSFLEYAIWRDVGENIC